MDKQTVVYPYNRILLINANELLIHIQPWINLKRIYNEQKQPDQKIYTPYGPMDVEFNSRQTQSVVTAQDPVVTSYPQGIRSKTPSECLKPQIVLSPIYTMFFLMHIYIW